MSRGEAAAAFKTAANVIYKRLMKKIALALVVAVLPTWVAAQQSSRASGFNNNPCAKYGVGFAKIAGSDTCVKIGGSVGVEAGGSAPQKLPCALHTERGGSAPSPPSMVERIKKNLTPEASWIIPTLFCRSNVEDGLIQI